MAIATYLLLCFIASPPYGQRAVLVDNYSGEGLNGNFPLTKSKAVGGFLRSILSGLLTNQYSEP
jgi:hypothetical protein